MDTSLYSSTNINDNNKNPELQSDKGYDYSSEILSDTFKGTTENLISDSEESKQSQKYSEFITNTMTTTEKDIDSSEESKDFSSDVITKSSIISSSESYSSELSDTYIKVSDEKIDYSSQFLSESSTNIETNEMTKSSQLSDTNIKTTEEKID